LAFGNGANDVLSAFAAGSGEGDEGIYMSMGAIMGSCIFVTTVVSSLVVLVSKEKIKVMLIQNIR
jgi:Ca2+/Na+ antiporter